MSTKGWSATVPVAVLLALALVGCSNGHPYTRAFQSISFLTQTIPPADAGRLYNYVIRFESTGGAELPDRFELTSGVLPTGVTLTRDKADNNLDGLPDDDGAYTGNARLLGVPRQRGSYTFTLKAISTGGTTNPEQPDLATSQTFSVNVSEGTIAILTPTAEEGTSDPAVPAFPNVVPFVNPSNPDAFFPWSFLIAGGSNNNIATVYMPRELELSTFDKSVVDETTLHEDVDESSVPGAPANMSKFEQNFTDGGLFVLQAGQQKVQIGGFQSPRGPVRTDGPDAGEDISSADPPFLTNLLPEWFQDAGTPKSSRRDYGDSQNLAGGDDTLGTEQPVQFTDYFDAGFKSTTPTPDYEAKYPFTSDQYLNAFFVPYTSGVDLTPLSFRLIVEAIDTRGTPTDKSDDVIARKAYIMRIQIPDLTIDTVLLPAGQAGVLYGAQISLSGGVPPLFADLEWVDTTKDFAPTASTTLTKDLLGIELNPKTWQFIGAPRVAAPDTDPSTPGPDGPVVELTVRAWAQVMNPVQAGAALVPTGNTGEKDGTLDPDGAGPAPAKAGRHRTYQVNFELPTAPSVSNASLKAGIDGQAYPGDRITGTGGVPLLAPYPPGFFDASPNATYPSATAQRAYEWSSEYTQDTSPQNTPGAVVPGLPYNLTLETSPYVATNGNITGSTFDRGFHPCRFVGKDFYAGNVALVTPNDTAYQTTFEKTLVLSVSPDQAVYLRGVQSSEGSGGIADGLLTDDEMKEQRMVPIMLGAGLFSVDTGKSPVRYTGLPTNFDTLPVLLVNGGTDSHNNMSMPEIRGFWPAEANHEQQWYYYPGLGADQAWKHLQQEFTWIQAPDAKQHRVFLWAEGSTIKTYNASYGWNQMYQQMDITKKRGVFVLDLATGNVHVPALLDPSSDPDAGLLFGAEFVVGARTNTYNYAYYEGSLYMKNYYYGVYDSVHDREVHMHSGGTFLQTYSTTYSGTGLGYYMMPQGRTGVSVAMSADGKWCATALVGVAPSGTNEQKILLWRNDNTPIPAAILAQSFSKGVPWVDEQNVAHSGTDNPRAVILRVGGDVASGVVINQNQRYLLPDSIMFVENGLIFLNETQLNRVFGVSLIDGHLSSIDINAARQQINGAGLGPTVDAGMGQFIPDNDKLTGCLVGTAHAVQFSWAGNKPAAGEEGPNKVAFVAGTYQPSGNLYGGYLAALTDLSSTTHPRAGYSNSGNTNKSLYFMDMNTAGATGLELSTSKINDLTGSSSSIYGDLLTPGRFGEELDRLVLSDDGAYAAVVRDVSINGYFVSTYYSYYGGFATAYYYYVIGSPSSYDGWLASQDLIVVSTSGAPMQASSTKHVLFLGTGQASNSAKGGMPSWAVQATHLNAAGRRLFGLAFAPDGERLIMNYAGGDYYIPTGGYYAATNWQMWNPSYTSYGVGDEISVSLKFRNGANPENFSSTSNIKNNLQGLSGISAIGQTSAPIAETTSQQCFWANWKSENGSFMYYISDQIDGSTSYTSANRNFMVGFNMTANDIGLGTGISPVRKPFTAFIPHSSAIGFEQFDCNSWNYENRFASSPGGVFYNGRDAKGILCVIASDASAGAGSATDLEVYVMDENLGTELQVLTSSVTTGSANAINHLYLSADGNVLAGQASKTSSSSASSRVTLNDNSDLFVVTNIHAVLKGSTPIAFVVSSGQSHGSTVAFVGDASGAGPQALIYSSAASSGSNSSWANRTLKAVALSSGAIPSTLDSTKSHYAVLSGGRLISDDATNAN